MTPPVDFASDGEAHFEFYLARELGMTVGELRRRMTHRELVEWSGWFMLKNERERRAQGGASVRTL